MSQIEAMFRTISLFEIQKRCMHLEIQLMKPNFIYGDVSTLFQGGPQIDLVGLNYDLKNALK